MEGLENIASVFVVSNVAVGASYVGYWWLKGDDNYWKYRDVSYEPRRSLFQIYRDHFYKDDHKLEMERVEKYGKIYGYFERRKPHMVVCDAAVLDDMLHDHQAFPFRRVFPYPQPVFQHFIPTLNGPKWNRVRKTMAHAFATGNLKAMIPRVTECAEVLLDRLSTHALEGTPADCKGLFGDFAMDVLARCAFSINTDAQRNPSDVFVYNARNAFGKHAALKTFCFNIMSPYLRYLLGVHFLNDESVNFFKNTMMEVMRTRETAEKKSDFLDVMMEFYDRGLELQREEEIKKLTAISSEAEGSASREESPSPEERGERTEDVKKFLTYDELVAQSVMFFVVGYETVASLLCFLAYNLACHPEVQEELIQEIDKEIRRKGELSYEDVRDMPYLGMVVNETLRIQPPTIRAERTAVEDFEVPNRNFTIEKDICVAYSIYVVHHDHAYYSDPEEFRPRRFENANLPNCTFIPFGKGRRNCMGEPLALMEAKYCILKILRFFRFKTADVTTIPMKYVKAQGLLCPRDCMLAVERRQDVPGPYRQ